jgi:hypothetical protein
MASSGIIEIDVTEWFHATPDDGIVYRNICMESILVLFCDNT